MAPTDAIATRLTRLTETSLIVHWFTAEHGLVKTVAKGARRPKSAFAGRIDLFFGAEISFAAARKGELHSLREVAVSHWREGLRRNYVSMLLAGYCCQLLETAVEPDHPEPELFDLLRRVLDHLDQSTPTLRAMQHFESELARLLGISADRSSAESALRQTLSALPSTRAELLERLSPPKDFHSSEAGNHP